MVILKKINRINEMCDIADIVVISLDLEKKLDNEIIYIYIYTDKLKGKFMGIDWWFQGKSYVVACMKILGYFYDSVRRKKGYIYTNALLCAVLDNILNHNIKSYKNEDDYYDSLVKEYDSKMQSPTNFKVKIHTRLSSLTSEKSKYLSDREIEEKCPYGTIQMNIEDAWDEKEIDEEFEATRKDTGIHT